MYVNSAVPALCGIVASCGTSLILDLEKCIDMLVEFCKKKKIELRKRIATVPQSAGTVVFTYMYPPPHMTQEP